MAARDLDAAIAVTRFGLGAKDGEIADAGRDPKGFLKRQIRREGADSFPTNGETGAQRTGRGAAEPRDWALGSGPGDLTAAAPQSTLSLLN